jgi:hypothetical protein
MKQLGERCQAGCGVLPADCIVLSLLSSEMERSRSSRTDGRVKRALACTHCFTRKRSEMQRAVRVRTQASSMELQASQQRRRQKISPSVPPSSEALLCRLSADSSSEMAPEEGLEPTTLRSTALPASSPLVPHCALPSLLEVAGQAPCPRSSPQSPAETQDSAIISPSFDSPIKQSRYWPISATDLPKVRGLRHLALVRATDCRGALARGPHDGQRPGDEEREQAQPQEPLIISGRRRIGVAVARGDPRGSGSGLMGGPGPAHNELGR